MNATNTRRPARWVRGLGVGLFLGCAAIALDMKDRPYLYYTSHYVSVDDPADASLAFGVARLAQQEGAEVLLTGVGRGMSLTQRTARKLPTVPDVVELDDSALRSIAGGCQPGNTNCSCSPDGGGEVQH